MDTDLLKFAHTLVEELQTPGYDIALTPKPEALCRTFGAPAQPDLVIDCRKCLHGKDDNDRYYAHIFRILFEGNRVSFMPLPFSSRTHNPDYLDLQEPGSIQELVRRARAAIELLGECLV